MTEHNHEHKGGCCGQHHGHHEHKEGGCCGQHQGQHQHSHEHKEGGCCGHHHGHHHHHDQRPPVVADTNLSQNQVDFLHQLIHYQYLPVAQFLITSTTQAEFEVPALAPVFIRSVTDTIELVKEAGAFLAQLEQQGMITLDYDIPLEGYPYEEYHKSSAYTYFCQTVEEAKAVPNAVGDTANLILGSMAPTEVALSLFDTQG